MHVRSEVLTKNIKVYTYVYVHTHIYIYIYVIYINLTYKVINEVKLANRPASIAVIRFAFKILFQLTRNY